MVRIGLTLASAAAALILMVTTPMAATAAQQINRGGSLQIILDHEPSSLDPIFGNNPNNDRRYYNLFAESLVVQDQKGNFRPRLATSWEWSTDSKSIDLQLREGVKFQDGTPFDADAVKFNLERVMSPEVNARARQYVTDVDRVEVLDPHRIRIVLRRPSGAFMAVLAGVAGTVVSPTALRERGAEFARRPVGTGPFKIDSWTSGRINAVRFDDYWGGNAAGEKLPYVDRVEARVITNSAVKLVELRSGNAQLADAIQVKDFDQVDRTPGLELVDTLQGIGQFIAFNNTKPPFDNVELRKAVSLAINRQAIEKVISRGQGVALTGIEPPTSWAFSPALKGHQYDPDAAREALSKSGFKGPLSMVVIQRDPDTQIAQMVQAMLKQVGIEMRIEVLERQAWVDRTLKHDYQLGIYRASMPHPDPDITYSIFYGHDARQNYSGVANPVIWDLIEKARAETVQEKRRDLYVKIQETLLADYNQAYLVWRPAKEVRRVEVHGLDREFAGAWLYEGIWLGK